MVMALTAEMIIDAEIVTANCWKKRPVMPGMKAHGTNTAHSTSVIARIGPVISSIALIVADRASRPMAICRSMFSSTTMASSTTMPMASTRPNSEMLFRLYPRSAMTAKVPISDTGTSIIGRIMARQSCRNTSTTSPTSTMASNSVRITSAIDSRMNGVVS